MKIKQELMSVKVGTLAGDKILADAENDPNIEFKEDQDDDDQVDADGNSKSYGAGKLNQLFSKYQKSQSKTDQIINDFERNFGLRLQKLNDNLEDIDEQQDAEKFEKFISSQFQELKKSFRGVVDNIRTKDYKTFVRINEGKAQNNEKSGAYNKLEDELSKLKKQMDKAN